MSYWAPRWRPRSTTTGWRRRSGPFSPPWGSPRPPPPSPTGGRRPRPPAAHYARRAATLVAFFLAVGIAAHALDELNGRPLRTRIPSAALWSLAAASLLGAMGLGVLGSTVVSPWLLAFVTAGAFFVLAYNLELFGGRFHSDAWFALAWGALPPL